MPSDLERSLVAERAEVWARHVEAQRVSGQTQSAYCELRGLQPRLFRRWAQRLRQAHPPVDGTTPPGEDRLSPSAGTGANTRTSADRIVEPVGEVLTNSERRRRWTEEQKLQLVGETFDAGSSISRVARRYGVHSSVLFRWRRQLAGPVPAAIVAAPTTTAFAAVEIAPQPMPMLASPDQTLPAPLVTRQSGVIEIELSGGHRVRVDRDVDADALRRVVAVLATA